MVTIRDVAAAAGVSPSTVSYVVTGNKRLPPATVAKVQASIRELGYRPSAAGRALSLGRTNIIGLVAAVLPELPEAEADIFMRFVRAAIFSAKRDGYNILMMDGGEADLRATPLVDGLLVMDVRYREERIPVISSLGIPAVLVGMPEDAAGLSAVDLDFAGAGRLAVDHLAALGHRDVAVVGSTTAGTSELSWSVRFHRGVDAAAAEHGVYVRTWAGGATVEELDRWLDEERERLAQTTAVVLLNVALVEPLFRRASERGVRVPEDLSVIVLASRDRLERLYPTLTLLDVPGDAMLDAAVMELLRIMGGAAAGSGTLLPAHLVTRHSTAAPLPGGVGRLRR